MYIKIVKVLQVKGSDRVPVIYVALKHIGRLRGAGPDLVTVENESIIVGNGSSEPLGFEHAVVVRTMYLVAGLDS